MPFFKCKMCGGSLEIAADTTVIECEYCGTQQTLPKLDDEKRANMYDRANHFRRSNDFDKAMAMYESILNEDSTDAEVYWSLVLCRYGIEYVEDPSSHKRIPTVNRAQFTSIFDDENYKSALEYADSYQRVIYEAEAKEINKIQRDILAISQNEDPFDIFICYKETDKNGRRTQDSVLAQELYYQLKQEGFKVFFSRITLEDKLGSAYEPYIFAALNSAKVMVVLGTKSEHFNAVWVKNEWSRYLALIKQGKGKMLIPAYRDMDPYDLPEEFSHLQAQDMSKLGFMQDLVRGIKKIIKTKETKTTIVKETVVTSSNTSVVPLLKRVFIFLEDGDWESADEYAEKVLDIEPENANAYLGKLMAKLEVCKQEELKDYPEPFDDELNYQKVLRYADDSLRNTLTEYTEHIKERNEQERLEGIYELSKQGMESATTQQRCLDLAETFRCIAGYKDAEELAQKCVEKAEACRKDSIYNQAVSNFQCRTPKAINYAISLFKSISGWRDSEDKIVQCKNALVELEEQQEAERIRLQKQAIAQSIAKELEIKRIKQIAIIISSIVFAIIMIAIISSSISKRNKYNEMKALMKRGDYAEAYVLSRGLGNYKDTEDIRLKLQNDAIAEAEKLYLAGNALAAADLIDEFAGITGPGYRDVANGNYKDAVSKGLTHIVVPNGTTEIKSKAFSGCGSMAEVTIPSSVTRIGTDAFDSCKSLTKVNITDLSSWCNISFANISANPLSRNADLYINGIIITRMVIPTSVTKINDYAFYGCKSVENVTISNGVTSIGACAFYNCAKLKSVTIPNTVVDIRQNAFYNCTSLTSITIPDSVTSIGSCAFEKCTSLMSVTIPDSVTSIGYSAFYGCTSLTSIKYCGTTTQWNAISKGTNWNYRTGQYAMTYNYTGNKN